MIKELIKDVYKYLPSFIVPAIVGVIALPIKTRLFSPADYGDYVLVLATVSVLSAIATAWISASIIRFFPAYEVDKQTAKFYGTVAKLTLLSIVGLSLAFSGVLFLAQKHISSNLYSLMHIGILLFVATSCSQVLLSFLRIKRQVTWYSSLTIWRTVAGLGVGVLLVIVFHYGVGGLLWGPFLSTVVAFPLLYKLAIGKVSLKEGRIHSRMSSEILRYGLPIAVVNIASWILSLSDRYVLELFRTSHEVGIYAANYAIPQQSILMIGSLFMISSGPIGVRIWESQGMQATKAFLNKLTRYYLLAALPAAVGLGVLAKPFASLLLAQAYVPGYRIIPVVAFGMLIAGSTHSFSLVLTLQKRSDLLMYCFLGAASLNIGLNVLLIPVYGYMAAAITTLVAYTADLALRIGFAKRFFTWEFPFKSLGKAACASAIMGAVVYPIGTSLTASPLINLTVGIPLGVLIYVVSLFLVREIQPNEKQVMKQLLMRYLPKRMVPNSWKE